MYFVNFSSYENNGFSKNLFLPAIEKIYCLCCFRVSRTPDWVTNRERTVCPRYAKYVVNTDKGAVVCKLKLGPQEMWSVLRLENVSAVSFSLVGKCYLYICKKNQQDAHFFH